MFAGRFRPSGRAPPHILPRRPRLIGSGARPEGTGDRQRRHELGMVMFTDITGFTRLAEGLEPEAVAMLLTRHFHALAGCIEAERGTVGQIQGDGLLAFWTAGDHTAGAVASASASVAAPAAPALRAAGAIRAAVEAENGVRSRRRLPRIRL